MDETRIVLKKLNEDDDLLIKKTAKLIQSTWSGKRKLEDRIEAIRNDSRQKEKLPGTDVFFFFNDVYIYLKLSSHTNVRYSRHIMYSV